MLEVKLARIYNHGITLNPAVLPDGIVGQFYISDIRQFYPIGVWSTIIDIPVPEKEGDVIESVPTKADMMRFWGKIEASIKEEGGYGMGMLQDVTMVDLRRYRQIKIFLFGCVLSEHDFITLRGEPLEIMARDRRRHSDW